MWQQINAIGKATWDSFIELSQIGALSMQRLTQQEVAFMGHCAAMVLHRLVAPLQVKGVPHILWDETRIATEYGEKWVTNAQRVYEHYLQTQKELGQWVADTLDYWDWKSEAQQPYDAKGHRLEGACSLGQSQSTFLVDDPMLALLTRFACGDGQLRLTNEEFMLDQIATIQRYVAPFPPEQQNRLAREWIEQYAERYRQAWQKRTVYAQAAQTRCADCPLADEGLTANCDIHHRWLDLLNRYIADELSSTRYVEDALRLLTEHKRRLRVRTLRRAN
jgi:hypothetical protein